MRTKRTLKALLALAALILAGCISPGAVIEDIRANPDSGALIKDVPFFAQDELMCGPAALAGVIGYWSQRAKQDERMAIIAREVYNEKLEGTLPMDLLIYARRKGFAAEYYEGSLKDLKEKLSGGTPLVLFLNLGLDVYPIGHYIVAVGYSDRFKLVIAHSGLEPRKVYGYRGLLRAWSKTGFSTLLITPQIPPGVTPPANPRIIPEEGM